MSNADSRCCGSGVCIINQQGECWCGQVWNGSKRVPVSLKTMANHAGDDKPTISDKTSEEPKQ